MGTKTPTGNWTRTPRLTAQDIHERAVARRDQRNLLKRVFKVGDGAFYAPHRNQPTLTRKHSQRDLIEKIRMMPGSGTVSRLSLVP